MEEHPMGKSSKAKRAAESQSPGAREHELERLKEIEKKSYASRRRFWERDFLKAVYETWRKWPRLMRGVYSRQMARLSDLKPRSGTDSIRVIIDCSSPRTDPKKRSRWALALRLAADKKLEPSDLEEFFDEEGGVSGRASELEARSRTKKGKKPRQSKAPRHR
jgi:hypothetical protein